MNLKIIYLYLIIKIAIKLYYGCKPLINVMCNDNLDAMHQLDSS